MKFNKARIKNIILCVATGYCVGAMNESALTQIHMRTGSAGGEVLFVPLVVLLIWFGWMLRTECYKANVLCNKRKRRKQG